MAATMTRPGVLIGAERAAIDTPALLIDLDAMEHNLRRMAAKGRGGGRPRWWIRRWSGLLRHERAERSRALAAAVRDHGWDEARVRAVLLTIDPAQLSLFA